MSENLKLKRVIKSFVPTNRVVSVSSVFRIPMFMNNSERFPCPNEYVFFYVFASWSYIYGREYITVIQHRIHFYVNNQFYFKQFSLAWLHSLIVKNISI